MLWLVDNNSPVDTLSLNTPIWKWSSYILVCNGSNVQLNGLRRRLTVSKSYAWIFNSFLILIRIKLAETEDLFQNESNVELTNRIEELSTLTVVAVIAQDEVKVETVPGYSNIRFSVAPDPDEVPHGSLTGAPAPLAVSPDVVPSCPPVVRDPLNYFN